MEPLPLSHLRHGTVPRWKSPATGKFLWNREIARLSELRRQEI